MAGSLRQISRCWNKMRPTAAKIDTAQYSDRRFPRVRPLTNFNAVRTLSVTMTMQTDKKPTQVINLSGGWCNELGSKVQFSMSENGMLTGNYHTTVGEPGRDPQPLTGWTSTDGSHRAFGFTVLWENGESATAWTGNIHVNRDGEEILQTTWILTNEVDTCNDFWDSTLIGQDLFKREKK